MHLSDLQKKDIINLETGFNMGRIIDVEIDDTGKILRFSTEPKKVFKRVFRTDESIIEFSRIVKIGSDVILIK
ncbi:MAG: YlmC/YmxH family sporulation protein [bacterium]